MHRSLIRGGAFVEGVFVGACLKLPLTLRDAAAAAAAKRLSSSPCFSARTAWYFRIW